MKLRIALALTIFCQCCAVFGATNAIDPAQLAYNLKTLVEPYDKVGGKDPKWDANAKQCLTTFATMLSWTNGEPNQLFREMRTNLFHLESLKCTDPMIRYMAVAFVFSATHSAQETLAAYRATASALQKSGYPDIRKFYAVLRVGSILKNAGAPHPEVISAWKAAADYLGKAFDDKSMPLQEADQSCEELMSVAWWAQPTRWNLYTNLEPALTNRWNGTELALLTKGRAYISYAWLARSLGATNSTGDQGRKLMSDRLDIAANALEAAWKLNPSDIRICAEMMRVEMGQGKSRDRLELWFQRGMKLDPSNNQLCYEKLEYLRPAWHGSPKQMIDFGRECTQNTNWVGSVRLLLADAHYDVAQDLDEKERGGYWHQPNVWPDIHSTFEQFFKLYPGAASYRQNYARYAIFCGQWQEFQNQVKLFPSTNYEFFGGIEAFNRLTKLAAEQVKKK